MERSVEIAVRASDGKYVAKSGCHTVSCTAGAQAAAERLGAKLFPGWAVTCALLGGANSAVQTWRLSARPGEAARKRLRPFPGMFERSMDACLQETGEPVEVLGGPDKGGLSAVIGADGYIRTVPCKDLREAPLTWLHGQPVYYEDRLWFEGHEVQALDVDETGALMVSGYPQIVPTVDFVPSDALRWGDEDA